MKTEQQQRKYQLVNSEKSAEERIGNNRSGEDTARKTAEIRKKYNSIKKIKRAE